MILRSFRKTAGNGPGGSAATPAAFGDLPTDRERLDWLLFQNGGVVLYHKQQIMTEYATVEGDTGSPEVQIAMLTQRIKDLTEQSRAHKHDHHSRRGLLLLVGRRKRMLRYLEATDIERYRSLIKRLGLRR